MDAEEEAPIKSPPPMPAQAPAAEHPEPASESHEDTEATPATATDVALEQDA